MSVILKRLSLAILSLWASADAVTNKTFITPHTPVFFGCSHRSTAGEHHYGLTYSYRHFEATNHSAVGKYFGFDNKHEIQVDDVDADPDVTSQTLLHDALDAHDTLKGLINLAPRREVNEISMGYRYGTELFNCPLSLAIHLPLVHVRHDLHARVTGERTVTLGADTRGVLDFFYGNISQTTDNNKQSALAAARWTNRSYAGLAGVALDADLEIWEGDAGHLAVSLVGMIPLEHKPRGVELFEPVLHNGAHWEVGCGVDGAWNVGTVADGQLTITPRVQARYLISNTQKRTVGLAISGFEGWAWYQPLGEIGKAGVFPAANVLTRDVSVHPGLRAQASVNARLAFEILNFDFGYGINWKDAEKVRVTTWDDTKYALAQHLYDTANNFSLDGDRAASGLITRSMLNETVAASPSLFVQHIMGSIGIKHEFEAMLVSGLVSGGYEFVSGSTRGLDGWTVAVSCGCHF